MLGSPPPFATPKVRRRHRKFVVAWFKKKSSNHAQNKENHVQIPHSVAAIFTATGWRGTQ
jgi:hypothetical protein